MFGFVLTKKGKKLVNAYIDEMKEKKEKIIAHAKLLGLRYDPDDETRIPSPEDILRDIEEGENGHIDWKDHRSPCYRAVWPVTNRYDADRTLCLRMEEDFEIPDSEDEQPADPAGTEGPMRYALISVTREEMDIVESYYRTSKDAFDAMIEDMLISTAYSSKEEIVAAAAKGECGLSANDAWAKTRQFGTGTWKIIELPASAPHKVYVYKQYNDEYAYGEEDIQVFIDDKVGAEAKLREDAESYFGVPWKYIPFKATWDWDESAVRSFRPDYLVICPYGENSLHWIIEEKDPVNS